MAVPDKHDRIGVTSFSEEQGPSHEQSRWKTIRVQAKVSRQGRFTLPKAIREMHRDFFAGNTKRSGLLLDNDQGNRLQLVLGAEDKPERIGKTDEPRSAIVALGKTHAFTIPKAWREALQLNGALVELTTSPGLPIIIEKATRMEETRAERLWFPPDETVAYFCRLTKNLYNQATYLVRQEFFSSGRWVRYQTLYEQLKESPNYKDLPAQTGQQLLRLVDAMWASYFAAKRDWEEHPDKYLGKPRLPKYKPKDGQFLLLFTNQQVKLEQGLFKLPDVMGIVVKTRLTPDTAIRGARVVPKGTGYVLEILYTKTIPVPPEGEPNRVAGQDIGLTNLVTEVNNTGERPVVVKGGVIKSINQYFNKERARLQSIYDKQDIKEGKKMRKLADTRDRKINALFHEVSRATIDRCVARGIDTLVIGRNEGWKQEVPLGKRTNQNFVSVPYDRLFHMLAYKGRDQGIRVVFTREAYTSKCSFLDKESIQRHDQYLGKRIKRGLFRSAKGLLINSDVNGGYNITVQVVPNAFSQWETPDGIEGVWLHPVKWTSNQWKSNRRPSKRRLLEASLKGRLPAVSGSQASSRPVFLSSSWQRRERMKPSEEDLVKTVDVFT
jgi:IS605 OrfB family transposase